MSGRAHTHPDPAELVIGCQACIERVQRDQEQARWAEAPLHHVTFHFAHTVDRISADLRIVPGADADEIAAWYSDWLLARLVERDPDIAPHADLVVEWAVPTVGQRIEDVQAVPVDHPSLFGAA